MIGICFSTLPPEARGRRGFKGDEVLPLLVNKYEPPVNDAGDDVVIAKAQAPNARLSQEIPFNIHLSIDLANTSWKGRNSDN
jgi:hypothetical protein